MVVVSFRSSQTLLRRCGVWRYITAVFLKEPNIKQLFLRLQIDSFSKNVTSISVFIWLTKLSLTSFQNHKSEFNANETSLHYCTKYYRKPHMPFLRAKPPPPHIKYNRPAASLFSLSTSSLIVTPPSPHPLRLHLIRCCKKSSSVVYKGNPGNYLKFNVHDVLFYVKNMLLNEQ